MTVDFCNDGMTIELCEFMADCGVPEEIANAVHDKSYHNEALTEVEQAFVTVWEIVAGEKDYPIDGNV